MTGPEDVPQAAVEALRDAMNEFECGDLCDDRLRDGLAAARPHLVAQALPEVLDRIARHAIGVSAHDPFLTDAVDQERIEFGKVREAVQEYADALAGCDHELCGGDGGRCPRCGLDVRERADALSVSVPVPEVQPDWDGGQAAVRAAAERLNGPMMQRLRACAADASPNWDGAVTVYPPAARGLVALVDSVLALAPEIPVADPGIQSHQPGAVDAQSASLDASDPQPRGAS